MKSLRIGLRKRLSGCAHCPGRPGLVALRRPAAAGEKRSGFNCPLRRGSGVYSNRPGGQNGNPGIYHQSGRSLFHVHVLLR
jgi:hypothetical protein